MKYSQWIGILATVILCVACFFPWTYYPDLNAYFTGFYSEGNMYGRPGKFFFVMGAIAIVFFAVNKIWAKRANLLICALIVAYAVRIFFLFVSCYRGICPERQAAVYIVLLAPVIMLVMAFLPRMNKI
jgi:cytochrome c oxidase subunit IV